MRPRLDAIDLKILATLQKEGRITKQALAERVNLSPTPCWERLKRLEKAGFIKGYRAEIDLAKLAAMTTVLVEVVLLQHRLEDFEIFERAVQGIPEIVECLATGGGIDYLLKIVTRDIDAYQRLIDELLAAGHRHRALLHLCGHPQRQDGRPGAGGGLGSRAR